VITRYYAFIDKIPDDSEKNILTKRKYREEMATLLPYDKTTSIKVQVLQFTLDLPSLKLEIA
jgi:hypothetical protein